MIEKIGGKKNNRIVFYLDFLCVDSKIHFLPILVPWGPQCLFTKHQPESFDHTFE